MVTTLDNLKSFFRLQIFYVLQQSLQLHSLSLVSGASPSLFAFAFLSGPRELHFQDLGSSLFGLILSSFLTSPCRSHHAHSHQITTTDYSSITFLCFNLRSFQASVPLPLQ